MTMSCRNSLPSQLRRLSTTVSKKGVTIDNDPAVLLLRDFAHGPRMFSCLCPGWVRHPWRQRCNRMSSRQQEPVAGVSGASGLLLAVRQQRVSNQ
jgi:hypothetical protein